MKKYHSFLADILEKYESYRLASGRTSHSYIKNLIFFDHYCTKEYPSAEKITQEMIDKWCAQRVTECNNSVISRVYPVLSFLRFAKERELIEVQLPLIPKGIPRIYIPHAFTDEELNNFFCACDSIDIKYGLNGEIRKITIPVLFRLLYSSGMRTTEARLLRCEDVDLQNGIVNIKYSKGYNQHFVVLHDSMLELMRTYDLAVSGLLPGRVFFFASTKNKNYPGAWISYYFRKLWQERNHAKAVAYELRHHYAIENINSWIGDGLNLHTKLLSLSKSMGHGDIESTKKYYALTPGLANIIEKASEESFNDLIPDIEQDEKNK
jgi:site-specific recombinase XerD